MADDATTEPAAPIAGWAGLLVPYDQPSVDGRVIRRPPGGARIRDLPLELKFQQQAVGGHDGAIIGLANITNTWEDEQGLWASGEFDWNDPAAVRLAEKIRDGFVGHVSVDLGDFTTAMQQLSGDNVEAVTDWKLLSTTIVADAAMDGARIFTITDGNMITPTAKVMAQRRTGAGVFADRGEAATTNSGSVCTLTFGNRIRATVSDVECGRFAVIGATDLPWAARDRNWDQAAARSRMAEACGGAGNLNASCYARGFLVRDGEPDLLGSYKFPFADMVDGQLRAVYGGLSTAAGRVDAADIPAEEKERLRGRIRSLYASAARAFDDENLTAPFDIQQEQAMDTDTTDATGPDAATEQAGSDATVALQNEVDLDALASRVAETIAPLITEAVEKALADREVGTDEVEQIDEDMPVPQMSARVRMARALALMGRAA